MLLLKAIAHRVVEFKLSSDGHVGVGREMFSVSMQRHHQEQQSCVQENTWDIELPVTMDVVR